MNLLWREVEPHLVERARNCARDNARASTPRPLEPVWSFFALGMAVGLVSLYLSVFLHLAGSMALVVLAPGALIGLITLPFLTPPDSTGRRVSGDALKFVADNAHDRAERLYVQTLLLLLETPVSKNVGRSFARELRALATQDAQLSTQSERLTAALDPDALAAVETERASLIHRLAASDDPIERGSLSQSLSLCDERVEQLNALPKALARIDAHREVIFQALAFAHAALTRARSIGPSLTYPDIETLRESVRRLTAETDATEEVALQRRYFDA